MRNKKLSITAMLCLSATTMMAQGLKPALREHVAPPAAKQKFKLYLLVGQSNMAGRGYVEAQDTIPNQHVLRLNKNGEWEIGKDPLHFDKDVAGVGPGLQFGKTLAAADQSAVIGLIPCAVGGSAIENWKAGSFYAATKTYPYDDAIKRAKLAMQSGTLMGIIWHQGESDSNPVKSATYQENLKNVIASFRHDLDSPEIPFVAGELPAYQIAGTDAQGKRKDNPSAEKINEAIENLKTAVKNYAYVTAEGTSDRGDHTHFNAASARLMGIRYAKAMMELSKQNKH